MIIGSPAREQTRARDPDEEGFIERDGVQVDPPGNGCSDRPRDAVASERSAVAEYAVAVLDAARVEREVVVSWCGLGESLLLAAEHPDRVSGLVFIAPALPVGEPEVPEFPFDEELETDAGWAKENRHYWLRDWRGYVEFFVSKMFTEPHSTMPIEDCAAGGWRRTPRPCSSAFMARVLEEHGVGATRSRSTSSCATSCGCTRDRRRGRQPGVLPVTRRRGGRTVPPWAHRTTIRTSGSGT